jgi:RimJ/RimL family protein N-acetyltransferase
MKSIEFISSLDERITNLINVLKTRSNINVNFIINEFHFTPSYIYEKDSYLFTITLPTNITLDMKESIFMQLVNINAKNIRLETKNLLICPLNINYVEDYFELCSDASVMIPSGDKIIKTLDEAIQDIILERDYGNSNCLILKSENKLIGALVFYLRLNTFMEIGYDISSKYQGHGYGTEAIKAIIDYAFNVLDIDYIIARTFIDNPKSEHILKKLGFVYIETIKNDYLHQEYLTLYDTKNFSLLNPRRKKTA